MWTKLEAETWVDNADEACRTWRNVRMQEEAQDFLLQLFLPKMARS